MSGCDVEEDEFIGASQFVARRQLNGITSIANVDEVSPLDDAAISYVEAWDNALHLHVSRRRSAHPAPVRL